MRSHTAGLLPISAGSKFWLCFCNRSKHLVVGVCVCVSLCVCVCVCVVVYFLYKGKCPGFLFSHHLYTYEKNTCESIVGSNINSNKEKKDFATCFARCMVLTYRPGVEVPAVSLSLLPVQ